MTSLNHLTAIAPEDAAIKRLITIAESLPHASALDRYYFRVDVYRLLQNFGTSQNSVLQQMMTDTLERIDTHSSDTELGDALESIEVE